MAGGSLVVVGSGIRAVAQMTEEARRCIVGADRIVLAVSDPLSAEWIRRLNPSVEDLLRFYREGEDRWGAYRAMVQRLVDLVVGGQKVCAVFYGHPGVFVYPAHEAIRRLRREGHPAVMLPGISAEDCLFADLGVEPLRNGCLSFEATDFLVRRREPDPSSFLILWQVDAVGDNTYRRGGNDRRHTPLLLEYLYQWYRPDHEVCLYNAAVFPLCRPVILRVPLNDLPVALQRAAGVATLCIPPAGPASLDEDRLLRLGLTAEDPPRITGLWRYLSR
jgi:precorrin-6B methylase 1